MTNKNKTSSDASTSRSHQKRKITYTPPSYLDAPKPNVEGVKYRWLRVSVGGEDDACLLYTSPSPRDLSTSRMPSSA